MITYPMHRLILAPIIALMLGLSTSLVFGKDAEAPAPPGHDYGIIDSTEFLRTAPPSFPDANVLVLFSKYEIDLYPDRMGDRWAYRHERLLVLNEDGVEELSEVTFRVQSWLVLEEFIGQTIYRDGTTHTIDKDRLYEKKVGQAKVFVVPFENVQAGCIVEYRTRARMSGMIAGWNHRFSSFFYTLRSEFGLAILPRMKYAAHASNLGPTEKDPASYLRKDSDGERRLFVWRVTDIPPLRPEPYAARIQSYIPALDIDLKSSTAGYSWYAGLGSWQEVGNFMENFVKDYTNLPRGYRKHLKQIVSGQETSYDKSKALYQWLVDSIVTDRSGSRVVNEDFTEAYKRRTAAPFEKNLMLLDMLRKNWIDAWPVFIGSRDMAAFDPSWISPEQFDHVLIFAEVEQGGIYLDASSAFCPYGTLPSEYRAHIGLMAGPDSCSFVRIISGSPASYRMDMTMLTVHEDGSADGTVQSTISGYLGVDFGTAFETMEPETFFRDSLLSGLPNNSELKSYDCRLDEQGRVVARAEIYLPRYASRFAGNLALPTLTYMFGSNPFSTESRVFPVDFEYGFTYHHVLNISHGVDTAATVTIPESLQLDGNGMSFVRVADAHPGAARIESRLVVQKPQHTVDEYPLLKAFFEQVALECKDEIIVATGSAE